MSARAPAGIASSITGRLSAASTSATIDGDEESEVISQPAPTSCIQVPRLETIDAIQRLRNRVFRSGPHGDWVLRCVIQPGRDRSTAREANVLRIRCSATIQFPKLQLALVAIDQRVRVL